MVTLVGCLLCVLLQVLNAVIRCMSIRFHRCLRVAGQLFIPAIDARDCSLALVITFQVLLLLILKDMRVIV